MPGDLEVDALPLILCGPILRRVEPDNVSVFVALKHPRFVELTVRKSNSVNAAKMFKGGAETVPLGTYLHVAVITARHSESNDTELNPGTAYGYDLKFSKLTGPHQSVDPAVTDAVPDRQTLADLGLLSGELPLGYQAGKLPSFSLPPDNLEDLIIIHGSCRKPHGEGPDMLATVDALLEADRSPNQRPHQLFLTGDQIYADDVSVCLLDCLRSNATALLAPTTPERIETRNGPRNFDSAEVKPYHGRPAFMANSTKYTSGENHNHLIYRAEYYLMYLMAWSDVLWPRSPTDGAITLSVPEDVIGAGVTDETELAELEKPRRDAATARSHALSYGRRVKFVRRALANIPCYMIFDDHEITDDWNLHGKWRKDSIDDVATRRLLRNGLAAYAVFQDWGNDPNRYEPGLPGNQILDAVKVNLSDPNKPIALEAAPDSLDQLLDLVPAPSDSQAGPPSPLQRQFWHYQVDAPTHRVIVLDTRTMRAFGDKATEGAALLSSAAQNMQLDVHQPRTNVVDIVISPAPVHGLSLIEDGLQHPAMLLGFSEKLDTESWGGNREAHERLMRSIGRLEQVVLLSGDVHYAFSNNVAYFREDDQATPARIVQLCASSLKNEDMKTRGLAKLDRPFLTSSMIGIVHDHLSDKTEAIKREVLLEIERLVASAQNGTSPDYSKIDNLARNFFRMASQDRPTEFSANEWVSNKIASLVTALTETGDRTRWRSRTKYSQDNDSESIRITESEQLSQSLNIPDDPTFSGSDEAARKESADFSRNILGFANIGKLTFEADTAGKPTHVHHQLLWHPRDPDGRLAKAIMTTTHLVPFLLPDPVSDRPEVTE